jgi:hypothetical protein
VRVLLDDKLDISEYTHTGGQKRTSFRILADAYRLLKTQRGGFQASPFSSSPGGWRIPPTPS